MKSITNKLQVTFNSTNEPYLTDNHYKLVTLNYNQDSTVKPEANRDFIQFYSLASENNLYAYVRWYSTKPESEWTFIMQCPATRDR